MTLNRYGLLALDFCRRHRPTAWASTSDPTSTFETIGEEIQAQVTQTRDRLVGPTRPGEHPSDLDRRASQALATAEELVLADHPAFQPEPTQHPDRDPEEDPVLASAWATLSEVNEAVHRQPS